MGIDVQALRHNAIASVRIYRIKRKLQAICIFEKSGQNQSDEDNQTRLADQCQALRSCAGMTFKSGFASINALILAIASAVAA